MSKSEIAQLRQRIELELDSMRRGLAGYAAGHARHLFIHTRMERIGACQDVLAAQLGEVVAARMVCQLYTHAMDRDGSSDSR